VSGADSHINDIVNYAVTERLKDGRLITIRAVRPDDKGLVIEAFHEMSAESLYRRLFAVKKDLTDEDLKRATEVDFVDVVQLVVVLEKDGREHLAGGGRYMRTGCIRDRAESGGGLPHRRPVSRLRHRFTHFQSSGNNCPHAWHYTL